MELENKVLEQEEALSNAIDSRTIHVKPDGKHINPVIKVASMVLQSEDIAEQLFTNTEGHCGNSH